MTSWIVPSPPQAKTVSLPSATAQRALSLASWLERQTVSSVRTPADWMMPMAWFSSPSRFFPRRPELGLNRMVALSMRRLALLSVYRTSRSHMPLVSKVESSFGKNKRRSSLGGHRVEGAHLLECDRLDRKSTRLNSSHLGI